MRTRINQRYPVCIVIELIHINLCKTVLFHCTNHTIIHHYLAVVGNGSVVHLLLLVVLLTRVDSAT